MIFKKKQKEKFTEGMLKTLSRDIQDIISQISVLKRDVSKLKKKVSELEKKK